MVHRVVNEPSRFAADGPSGGDRFGLIATMVVLFCVKLLALTLTPVGLKGDRAVPPLRGVPSTHAALSTQHSVTLTAKPPSDVSLYLWLMSAPVVRRV